MNPHLWVSEIEFSDGSKISASEDEVVLIVGPNNAGKSEALRAIERKLSEASISPVISKISLGRKGSAEEVVEWLSTFAHQASPESENPAFQAYGSGVRKSHVHNWWGNQSELHALASFFCVRLGADQRLEAANPAPNIRLLEDAPSHPIHFLMSDDSLESSLSQSFRMAFGSDLILNRGAGSVAPLHVGEKPHVQAGEDRVSVGYLRRLGALPQIQSQGDGMRSFTGVLLRTMVGRESILLVDEPEAFLHPPQARLLGQILVKEKKPNRQIFIATHSGDVLRGALDSNGSNVSVVRLRRSGDKNHVRKLDKLKLTELWGDPLLRYSNILDGVFHEKVVVCEADSDARFYAALSDAIFGDLAANTKRPDVMFTHCGGKDRVAMVVKALHELDVPVAAVLDFDVLNNEKTIRSIFEAAGGDWTAVAPQYQLVKKSVDGKKPDLTVEEIRDQILTLLANTTDQSALADLKGRVSAVLRRGTAWSAAKGIGSASVPSGDPTNALRILLERLSASGIFVVEVGELECFCKSIGNHGPKWINKVLELDLKDDPDLENARNFVRRIVK